MTKEKRTITFLPQNVNDGHIAILWHILPEMLCSLLLL